MLVHRFHDRADLAVVDPDRVPGPQRADDLTVGATDAGRFDDGPAVIAPGVAPGCAVGHKPQRVATKQAYAHRFAAERDQGHAWTKAVMPARPAPVPFEAGVGRQIGALPAVRDQVAAGAAFGDLEVAAFAARVGETEAVVRQQFLVDGRGYRQAALCRTGRTGGPIIRRCIGADQHGCRFDDGAVAVASHLQVAHRGTGGDRSGTQLLPGEIHEYPAGAAGFRDPAADIADHPPPGRPVIVGAIDARTVHALQQQLPHRVVVGGVVAGEGHHDADIALRGFRAEDLPGVFLQDASALGMGDDVPGAGKESRCRAVREAGQDIDHAVEIGEDVRLAAPERGQPDLRQPVLQCTQLVLAHRQVMGEIRGAGRVAGLGKTASKLLEARGRPLHGDGAQRDHLIEQRLQRGAFGARVRVHEAGHGALYRGRMLGKD